MNILAVDSSAVAASAAVSADGALLCEIFTQTALTHSETLLPAVNEALEKSGLSLSDIDRFAVTVGPGSFSGLRIGVTLVKTLAYGCGKPVSGVSTLEALAAAAPFCAMPVCPIMDARRDQVYTALYDTSDGAPAELISPRAVSVSELTSLLDADVLFVGDGVPRFADTLTELMGKRAHIAPRTLFSARAGVVALCAVGKDATDPMSLDPFYLRLSQAEREYNEKNGKGETI